MSTTENAKRPPATSTAKPHAEGGGRDLGAKSSASKSSAGTAAPPTQSAAPKVKQESPATKKKVTYEKRMRDLAPVVRVRRKLESTVKRFTKVAAEVERWKNAPALREAATDVATSLAAMLSEATTMPDDFKPERDRKANGHQLAVGAKVTLREKFVARYEDVLGPAERTSLEVISVARGHVSVKTSTGSRLVLPRGHVTRLSTSNPPAANTTRDPSIASPHVISGIARERREA
ncbi:MAG: hypothetical protein BGO98_13650 [Myxococcales bacterium 68-20]|mgnify:CR=1 FL=1|nr:hypothetical protein [Myxococcales bacterium]OJY17183.1 MAG: hypothetical protein BGO98_13650 [Myxococcales bacterium 68-20]